MSAAHSSPSGRVFVVTDATRPAVAAACGMTLDEFTAWEAERDRELVTRIRSARAELGPDGIKIELDADGRPVRILALVEHEHAAEDAFAERFPGWHLAPMAWWPEGPSPWRGHGRILNGIIQAEPRPGAMPSRAEWRAQSGARDFEIRHAVGADGVIVGLDEGAA